MLDDKWMEELMDDMPDEIGTHDVTTSEGKIRSLLENGSGFDQVSRTIGINDAFRNYGEDLLSDYQQHADGVPLSAKSADPEILSRGEDFGALVKQAYGSVEFSPETADLIREVNSHEAFEGVIDRHLGVDAEELFQTQQAQGAAGLGVGPEEFTAEAGEDAVEARARSEARSIPDFSRPRNPESPATGLAAAPGMGRILSAKPDKVVEQDQLRDPKKAGPRIRKTFEDLQAQAEKDQAGDSEPEL